VKIVDKNEFRTKIEQMLELKKNKLYDEAFVIAEELNWEKVKNSSVLCAVSEIYEQCGEYEKSRDILFMAYERSPESKKIIYRLGTLALKLGEFKEASDCYEEFVNVAPKDPNRFVLKYKMLQCQNAPIEEQIAVLEEFKKVEYVEKWAFELAGLYQKAGMISECLEECDDLILWFSEGNYIYKAMELKMQYKALTPLQHEKYMSRFGQKEEVTPKVEVKQEEETLAEEPKQEAEIEQEGETEMEEEKKETIEEPTEEVVPEVPMRSIEEMVQGWQQEQQENAQMIQAELERVEQEKSAEEPEEEEEKEEILSDDVRRLMEELEAESAEIEAAKAAPEVPEEVIAEKPLLQKVVEQLAGLDKKEEPEEEVVVEEERPSEEDKEEEIEEIETPDEDTEIKLGDTQSMALTAKALANAARVEVPEEVIPEIEIPEEVEETVEASPYDTGFVVQGRYDLDAQSEIGIKAGLTEEQKKLFSYFVPVHGMSEQLVQVLHADRACKNRYGTSRIGNIVIVGRRGSGKTVLAVNIIKAIQQARRMKHGKLAIVKAEALNKKDVAEIVAKLNGGALVIEKASRLNRNTIDTLCDLMEGQTGELLVVMEDERKPMDRMFAEFPNFKKKFTSRIEVPVFINDELVTFGQTYAKENGYKIDEMGILALYSDIDVLQREEKIVTVSDVKELIDDAIDNANRFTFKKLFKKIFGGNKDESDRVILKEEDFR
jgi:tetratricopeptide (TPR) repeat protein